MKNNILLLACLALVACGGSDNNTSNNASTFKYSTTSTRGDYTEWSITGDQLVANWQVINSSGQTRYTFNIQATCGTAAATGVQDCTFDTVACTAGVEACPANPTGSFAIMNVPGVALFASDDDQLHIGFAKDDSACSVDVSGDYSFIHMGLGKSDIFGMYQSDSDFINITHSDFGFSTADMNASQTLTYNTGTPNEMFQDDGCVDGVRSRTITGVGQIRSMMTASGVFVLDLPSGEGGILAYKAANAASLSDFANKAFGGLSFPDNDDPEPFSVNFGAMGTDKVDLTANIGGGVENLSLLDLGTAATLVAPAFPDFTVAPAGYAANPLQASYPTTDDIPGLFKIDGSSDSGRVIVAGVKLNSKVVAFGVVYNYRDTSDINPSTGANFSAAGLYNTGSFLMFEK